MNTTYYKVGDRNVIDKDPLASLDYTFRWVDWLALVGDAISSFVITTSPGLTMVSSTLGSGFVVVTVSGGYLGQMSFVTCKITTVGGRVDERTIYFNITPR